jgi:hypothetical protein
MVVIATWGLQGRTVIGQAVTRLAVRRCNVAEAIATERAWTSGE